jgi:hypothetical protein
LPVTRERIRLSIGPAPYPRIDQPTEEQLAKLTNYINLKIKVKRLYHANVVDDDDERLHGDVSSEDTIILQEFDQDGLTGIVDRKTITISFADQPALTIRTNYYGLNHPQGIRVSSGKRFITEITFGDEILFKVNALYRFCLKFIIHHLDQAGHKTSLSQKQYVLYEPDFAHAKVRAVQELYKTLGPHDQYEEGIEGNEIGSPCEYLF